MQNNDTGNRPRRWHPLILGLAVGIPFIAMGILFCSYLWGAYVRAKETRSWTPVSCLIEQSDIGWEKASEHSPIRYHVDLRYRYRFADQSRTSTKLKRLDVTSADKRKIEKLLRAYPAGSTLTCYVNPADADEAILKHAPLAPLYSIWFPSLFVLGGLGIVAGGARKSLQS